MDYFRQIPWCQKLIDDPGVAVFSLTFQDNPANRESKDTMFTKTLQNQTTIPHTLGLHPVYTPARLPATASASSEIAKRLLIPSASFLFDLHTGLNGFHGGVHGGVTALLIDEAMGNLIWLNHVTNEDLRKQGKALPEDALDMQKLGFMTTGINVRLQRPIKTPQVVLVKSEFVRMEGKKMFLRNVVLDSTGAQCAQSEGLWIAFPLQKL